MATEDFDIASYSVDAALSLLSGVKLGEDGNGAPVTDDPKRIWENTPADLALFLGIQVYPAFCVTFTSAANDPTIEKGRRWIGESSVTVEVVERVNAMPGRNEDLARIAARVVKQFSVARVITPQVQNLARTSIAVGRPITADNEAYYQIATITAALRVRL
jgi:hypothetical protein